MRSRIRCLLGLAVALLPAFCLAGERAAALATVTGGFVSSITVTSGGSGYVSEPFVSITGGGGTGASAKALLENGRVSLVLVLKAGSGYTNAPLVRIEPPLDPPTPLALEIDFVRKLTVKGPARTPFLIESSLGQEGSWERWTNLVMPKQETIALVDLRPESKSLRHRATSLFDLWHENSLGMFFAPVPGTKALFSVWETRVRDFAAYANAVGQPSGPWVDPVFQNLPVTPSPTHPVVNVSWEEAQSFCRWLTEKERQEGRLTPTQTYRLPTDGEWSWAVGIGGLESGPTPKAKSGQLPGVYPWSDSFVSSHAAANYAGTFPGSNDTFDRASPVGSFNPNPSGLYDMGGNVWEWCEDSYEIPGTTTRVVRGAAWADSNAGLQLSSFRGGGLQTARNTVIGFRCVLVDNLNP